MQDSPPKIDFSSLTYPSDGLSIKNIRSAHPQGFTQEDPAFFEAAHWGDRADFGGTLLVERRIAHKAFAARLGLPDPYPDEDWSRSELIEMLTESYQTYGIATGSHQTEQLAREIEAQAVTQAEEFLGRTR
jgi:hypothetical protein